MTVVGIDLGTTNTVVAAVRDGRATALKDKVGRALLPSVVSFTPRGAAKVGVEAKARRTLDPENTVFSIKRLMGRAFDSEQVKKAIPRLPFKLKEGPGHSVLVSCYGQDHTLPEISALVLKQAQEIAEARLGTPVTDAVITVPANFNDLQRAATKIAGRSAGLEVLRIINEPTAAALAYGFGKSGHERIAIYDFGGGTFDVTILDLNQNVFEVLATAGDTFLGGDDIDTAIMDRMAETLFKEQKVDANGDNLVREQLRAAAERLKIDLSTRSLGKTRIEELEFEFTMRRSEFEKLAEPLLARTLEVCKEAMEIADIDNNALDQVLLVGGSTRIPLVRRRISSFFGKMPQSRINPDEVVAIGAAIQASSLEAKQGASIPAIPGRISATPGRRASTVPSPQSTRGTSTRTGLAGLTKTMKGAGSTGTPLAGSKSLLGKMQTVAPSVNPPQNRKLSPAKTLAGVGGEASQSGDPLIRDKAPLGRTLSGVGDNAEDRSKGTTNLGLGVGPEVPPLAFDDVTKVARSPDADAAALDRKAERPKVGTIPGTGDTSDNIFNEFEQDDDPDEEVTEGSITFDLAALEGMDGEFDEEPTQVYDSRRAPAVRRLTDEASQIEELGDSALFSLEEADDDNDADLPSPASGRGTESRPSDSVLSALEEQEDLPSVSAKYVNDLEDDPSETTAVGHPPPHHDLPTRKDTAGLPMRKDAGLPMRKDAGLPVRKDAVGLPVRGTEGRDLPSPRASGGLDFESAIKNSPSTSASLDELDELSVAAIFPSEEGAHAGRPDLGATFGIETASLDDAARPPPVVDPDEAVIPRSVHPAFSPSHFLSQTAPQAVEVAPAPRPAPARAPLLLDVTPLSLGVEVSGGYVDRLIARNSPIPCESTRTFATTRDDQRIVRVRVSQGEEEHFTRNTLLGELELTGLSQGPRGTVKVDVSFSLDENGMLQVIARDVASGNAVNAQLTLVGIA